MSCAHFLKGHFIGFEQENNKPALMEFPGSIGEIDRGISIETGPIETAKNHR